MSVKKISIAATIVFATIGMALTYTTAGLVSMQQAMPKVNRQVSSGGTIVALNVGIYSDAACSQVLQSIDWGYITPGGSVDKTIYIKNTGNMQLMLSMTTNSWNPPAASGPLTLTWDKEGATLDAGKITTATLTLSVAQDIAGITTFSVAIVISGSA